MTFIKRILVPVDFSDASVNALKYAVTLAKMTNSEVKTLHVYSLPVVDPYMPGDTLEVLMKELKASAEKSMTELLRNFPGVSGECQHGFVVDDICKFAAEYAADLIVMGTTGASGMKEVFFGSNAAGVISQSPIKVMSVPVSYTEHKAPREICYASDFTGREDLPFQIFADLAKSWNAHLNVLHIHSEEPTFTSEKPEVLFKKLTAQSGLDDVSFAEITSNDVTAAIETYAQVTQVDVIGMAVHRRNLFEKLFHKSKTRELAHHTRIPLLSIKKG